MHQKVLIHSSFANCYGKEGACSEKEYSTLEATAEQVQSVMGNFDRSFIEGLYEGETEGLALIEAGSVGEARNCTGDAVATQALAMLGHSESGIAMEALLKHFVQKQLSPQFIEKLFRAHSGIGKENRITGRGLRKETAGTGKRTFQFSKS